MRDANWLGAGRKLMAEQRLAEAVSLFDAALRTRPADAALHYRRGEALFLLRRLDAALAAHAAACSLAAQAGTDCSTGMSGLVPGDFGWMSHMLRGDFESAWRLADRDREGRRAAGITGAGWPRHMRPVWEGAALEGARVLVRCYHGLGDTIHFSRYLPLLAERAALVRVEAQPELIPLLRTLRGRFDLVPLGQQDHPPAWFGCDIEIGITEMPHAFRTALATIPAAIPYLRAETERVREAARRLSAGAAGRRRVGLVWTSGAWKPERSVALEQLAPFAGIAGVALVNLQHGPEYRRWRQSPASLPMAEVFDTDDIADTAATIAALDLVITVDTMAAHLAGALGAPVWLMLHVAADWRWLLRRCDSPWYPAMRLFRQERPGDWGSVVGDVATALRQRGP